MNKWDFYKTKEFRKLYSFANISTFHASIPNFVQCKEHPGNYKNSLERSVN